ncbi:MAG: hypothetical protein QOJ90_364 [Actinomycetota bacterium]|jgi:glycosyltransferase involved in cell wall biosynthesis|nr:hypothetical protein [Actinomycetota bacterium]MDQ1641013.1 hypothetical protein [Actinomycetota bacterium]
MAETLTREVRRLLLVSELALRGGAETSTVLIAEAMQRAGIDSRLAFCRPGPMTHEAAQRGVRLIWGAGHHMPGKGRLRVPRVTGTARFGNWDIVHVSSLEQRCLWAARAALAGGRPTVAHLRNPQQVPHAKDLHDKGAYVVTNSSATEKALRSLGATRVRFIPNGIDPAGFRRPVDKASVLGPEGVPPGSTVGIVVANLTAYKGMDLLVPGLVAALRQVPTLHVLHVGAAVFPTQEAHAREVMAAIEGSGVADRLHMLGSRADVAALTAASDFAIVPSRGEGTARAILEAWSAELGVVAADVDGLNDLVVDGRSGLLVDLTDPGATARGIEALATDADLRTRLGHEGYGAVTTAYSHDAHVSQLLSVYHELRSRSPNIAS